ncbi:MAG TPA: hypothetical protein VF765_30000 [Polyangiaceae bacterium]
MTKREDDPTDPGPPPEAPRPQRNTSEVEPVDVIFHKIAQKEHPVPRSIERGESYQAVHEPAPASQRSAVEPPVVLNVTTDPDSRHQGQRARRGATPDAARNHLVVPVLVAASIVLIGTAVIAIALRKPASEPEIAPSAPAAVSLSAPVAPAPPPAAPTATAPETVQVQAPSASESAAPSAAVPKSAPPPRAPRVPVEPPASPLIKQAPL